MPTHRGGTPCRIRYRTGSWARPSLHRPYRGFGTTTGLSATSSSPATPSRASGWHSRCHRMRLPVLRYISVYMHAVAPTPAGPQDGIAHLVLQYPPSPFSRRVGSCIRTFEACSAFTQITACMLAKSSLMTRSIQVLQQNSLPPSSAPTATGWSDQLPGGTRTH